MEDISAPRSPLPTTPSVAVPSVPAPVTLSPPPPSSLSSSPSASLSVSLPPSQTLYLNHLNEKIHTPILRKDLYLLFSQFGNVLDVRAVRSDHLRGQAWVVMGEVGDAVKAVKEMDGFVMYGRPMQVSFAKTESDVVVKARGGTVPKRERRKLPSTKEIKARKVKQEAAAAAAAAHQHPPSFLPPSVPAAIGVPSPYPIPPGPLAGPPVFPPLPFQYQPPPMPNRILFVENLPPAISLSALSALFSPHAGYVETRLVPVRPGVAFVEWEDERRAGEAMSAMQGWKVEDGSEMRISYAKK